MRRSHSVDFLLSDKVQPYNAIEPAWSPVAWQCRTGKRSGVFLVDLQDRNLIRILPASILRDVLGLCFRQQWWHRANVHDLLLSSLFVSRSVQCK